MTTFLPPATDLSIEELVITIQCLASANRPHEALQLFNQVVVAAPTTINNQVVTTLFKTIGTSRFSSNYYSESFSSLSSSSSQLDNIGAISNIVMDGIAIYYNILENPSQYPCLQPDLILAQSMLSMCSSIPTQVALKNSRFLEASVDTLSKLLSTDTPPHVKTILVVPVILLAGKSGNIATAEALFNQLIETNGTTIESVTALMTAYNNNKQYHKSIDLCTQLLDHCFKLDGSQQDPALESSKTRDEESTESGNDARINVAIQSLKSFDSQKLEQAKFSACWPTDRTMYAFLQACHKGGEGKAAVCQLGLDVFSLWDSDNSRSKRVGMRIASVGVCFCCISCKRRCHVSDHIYE